MVGYLAHKQGGGSCLLTIWQRCVILWAVEGSMKTINITPEELSKIVENNKVIGQGSFGIVYQLDEDTLFKFRYINFLNDFEVVNGELDLRKLGDVSKTIETGARADREKGREADYMSKEIEHANAKQGKIRHTTLTQALVKVNGGLVGYALKYHKNMVNLFDYLCDNQLTLAQSKKVGKNIFTAVEELLENAIYLRDLSVRNIMVNPKTLKIEIIDLEDSLASTDVVDSEREDYVRARLKKINTSLLQNVLGAKEDC